MEVAPDIHSIENATSRPTTEAVDTAQIQTNTETVISKPQTIKIKRSLLLRPLSPEEKPVSIASQDSHSGNIVEDPRPITIDATNMQSGSLSGDVSDTPTQDEPRSFTINQVAENLTRDPITKETCIPIFSAITLKKKKKMLFAPMEFHELI